MENNKPPSGTLDGKWMCQILLFTVISIGGFGGYISMPDSIYGPSLGAALMLVATGAILWLCISGAEVSGLTEFKFVRLETCTCCGAEHQLTSICVEGRERKRRARIYSLLPPGETKVRFCSCSCGTTELVGYGIVPHSYV